MHTADRYLYLDADKRCVLEYGDLEAAYMFCNPGSHVHEHDMQRYGLTWKDGKIVLPEPGASTPASTEAAYDPRSEPAAQEPHTEPYVEPETSTLTLPPGRIMPRATKTEPVKAPKKRK